MDLTRIVPLELSGSVDMANEHEIVRQITEFAVPGAHVRLDLSAVTYMDSSGLRALIVGHHVCWAHGGNLVISAPSDVVRRFITLSGMSIHFGLDEEPWS